MTTADVQKYRYWADENGNIWERESYCLEPTVTFARLTSPGPCDKEYSRLGGAIGCMNLQGLKPIEMPHFAEQATGRKE